jgi:tRNA pseudouridine38-40 synthase
VRDPHGVICSANRNLPDDIAVTDCRVVEDDFHARYSVKAKEYEYVIYNGKYRHPMWQGRAYYYRFPLDVEKMNEGANAFVGTYDFTSFCAQGAKEGDKTRTVYAASVERQGNLVIFRVSADGFLYNMVRIMVGTLLRISQGKIEPSQIPQILGEKNRNLAGPTAPPEGLYLNQVFYE